MILYEDESLSFNQNSPLKDIIFGFVSSGFYCTSGSNTSNPSSVTSAGGPCPEGSYCEMGSSIPVPCPAGTYTDTQMSSNCTQCPPGYFCLAGSTNITLCPNGLCTLFCLFIACLFISLFINQSICPFIDIFYLSKSNNYSILFLIF